MCFSSLEVMDMNTFPSEKIKPHFKKLACWKKNIVVQHCKPHWGGDPLSKIKNPIRNLCNSKHSNPSLAPHLQSSA
jgi:hypothetical protein